MRARIATAPGDSHFAQLRLGLELGLVDHGHDGTHGLVHVHDIARAHAFGRLITAAQKSETPRRLGLDDVAAELAGADVEHRLQARTLGTARGSHDLAPAHLGRQGSDAAHVCCPVE